MFLSPGDGGLRSHVPAHAEPMEDRGERRVEGEEEGEEEEEEEEGRGREEQRAAAGPSIETQIGRKLREIGDQFQHDHIDTVRKAPACQRQAATSRLGRAPAGMHVCKYLIRPDALLKCRKLSSRAFSIAASIRVAVT